MDDRAEIAARIASLAINVDARRWDDLLDLFGPEVEVDYTSLFGGEPQVVTRDQLIGNWRQLVPGFTHTTHLIGTPLIDVSGNGAQASAPVVAWHFIREPELQGADRWTVGGCYEMTLNKLDGAWRITALTLARAWADGNVDLPRIAGERAMQAG